MTQNYNLNYLKKTLRKKQEYVHDVLRSKNVDALTDVLNHFNVYFKQNLLPGCFHMLFGGSCSNTS